MNEKSSRRPKYDHIARLIRNGAYDDALGVFETAITERRTKQQEAVRAQVREIFGDDWDITQTSRKATADVPPRPAIVSRQRPGSEPAPPSVVSGTSLHVEDAVSPPTDEPPREDPLGDNDPDIESRSPIIGGLPE